MKHLVIEADDVQDIRPMLGNLERITSVLKNKHDFDMESHIYIKVYGDDQLKAVQGRRTVWFDRKV